MSIERHLSRARRPLYRWGRQLGDLQALASGRPSKIVKRVARNAGYRHVSRLMRKVLG